MKRKFFLKMAILRSIALLVCFLTAEYACAKGSVRNGHHTKKKHHSNAGNKSSSRNSCRRSGHCKGQRSKASHRNSFIEQPMLSARLIRGLDGKDGRDGKPGEPGTPCEPCERLNDSGTGDFINAFSDEIQVYKGEGTVFQDITFNQDGVAEGWKHEPGSAHFTCPTTGVYSVTYAAGAGKFQKSTSGGVTIRACFGPLGAEEVVKGSDVSVYGTNFIQSTGKNFLLNGVEGQNFKLEFSGDGGETVKLTSINNAETTVSLTIVKV